MACHTVVPTSALHSLLIFWTQTAAKFLIPSPHCLSSKPLLSSVLPVLLSKPASFFTRIGLQTGLPISRFAPPSILHLTASGMVLNHNTWWYLFPPKCSTLPHIFRMGSWLVSHGTCGRVFRTRQLPPFTTSPPAPPTLSSGLQNGRPYSLNLALCT